MATSRECKFIETSSGIQHNVDELLVGVLKQIRLRETRDKKLRRQGSKGKLLSKLHNSKTVLSLNLAREILNKMCLNDNKSKSCENLHVLWKIAIADYNVAKRDEEIYRISTANGRAAVIEIEKVSRCALRAKGSVHDIYIFPRLYECYRAASTRPRLSELGCNNFMTSALITRPGVSIRSCYYYLSVSC